MNFDGEQLRSVWDINADGTMTVGSSYDEISDAFTYISDLTWYLENDEIVINGTNGSSSSYSFEFSADGKSLRIIRSDDSTEFTYVLATQEQINKYVKW